MSNVGRADYNVHGVVVPELSTRVYLGFLALPGRAAGAAGGLAAAVQVLRRGVAAATIVSLDLNDTIVALSSARRSRRPRRGAPERAGRLPLRRATSSPAATPVAFNRRRLYPGPRPSRRASRRRCRPICIVFPAPHTYTGQHVAELHTLGCPPLVELLIAELLKAGARAARPGEFTLRAFLAGKLDLTRAEAVLGVIEAGSRDELKEALAQLAGGVAAAAARAARRPARPARRPRSGAGLRRGGHPLRQPGGPASPPGQGAGAADAAGQAAGAALAGRPAVPRGAGRPAERRQEQPVQRPDRGPAPWSAPSRARRAITLCGASTSTGSRWNWSIPPAGRRRRATSRDRRRRSAANRPVRGPGAAVRRSRPRAGRRRTGAAGPERAAGGRRGDQVRSGRGRPSAR